MATFDVVLVVDREPDDDEMDAIHAAEVGVGGFETDNGAVLAHMEVEATNMPAAIAIAVRGIEQVGLHAVGVESSDLVSLKDIAASTGRTYESVRLLATGKRGPGGFPSPLSSGQWALYSWTEVARWFTEHYGAEETDAVSAEIAAADLILRARRILADGERRDEMARLLVA